MGSELDPLSAGASRRMMLGCDDQPLGLEAVRRLADRLDADSQEQLRSVATDQSLENRLRAEAIRGLASIIDPKKDIDPQFTTWLITTRQGQVLTGIILSEDASGALKLANAKGEVIQLRTTDIEDRQAQKTSIMPENLRDLMT